MGRARERGWEQAELDFTGHLEVVIEALFLLGDTLVELSVLNGDGDLRGEGGESADVVLSEVIDACVFDVEDADDLAFVNERDGELGAGFLVDFVVARILADVRNVDGTALGDGGADDAALDGDDVAGVEAFAEAEREAVFEDVFDGADAPDGEHLVIEKAAEELADAFEEAIDVKDGGKLAADFVEDLEGLRLA